MLVYTTIFNVLPITPKSQLHQKDISVFNTSLIITRYLSLPLSQCYLKHAELNQPHMVSNCTMKQCSIFTQYLFQNYPKQWRKNYIILLYGCSLIGFACPVRTGFDPYHHSMHLTTFYLNLVGYKMCAFFAKASA